MNQTPSRIQAEGWLPRWAFVNALVLAAATIMAVLSGRPAAIVPAAAMSFSGFLALAFRRLGPRRLLHTANFITLLRLMVVLALSFFGSSADYPVVIGTGAALLLADCLDGWAAGRSGRRSVFGEYFDKETDALWLLTVCLLATRRGALPQWVIFLGLLRYLFVIAIFSLNSKTAKEERSNRGRLIYTTVMLILLSTFIPMPATRLPLAFSATFLLGASFLIDTCRLFRRPRPFPGTGPGSAVASRRA